MRTPWHPSRLVRVGIAVARDRIVSVIPGSAPASRWVHPLTPPEAGQALPSDLAAALGDLRAAITAARGGAFRGALHVALLPPLAHVRRLELPGLKLAESRQVLRREPSRYLPVSAESAPLDLEIEGEGWRQASSFTLFAASHALVEGIHDAAGESGWRVAEIVPAEAAWAAAATSLLPGADDTGRVLVICLDDRVEVVRVRRDRILAIRRLPLDASAVVSLLQSLPVRANAATRTDVAVIGDSTIAGELRAALEGARRSHPIDTRLTASPGAVELLAATFAVRAAGPALLPEHERAAIARRATRATVVRFAAATALVVAAAGVQRWGIAREQGEIAAQRAALQEPVTRALAVRDSIARVTERLETMHRAATTAPHWASVIAGLSSGLPDDAYLLSLRVDNDSLRLEGSAGRAEGVFDALRLLPGMSALRPEGAIRQEIAADGSTSERFALSVRVVRAQ